MEHFDVAVRQRRWRAERLVSQWSVLPECPHLTCSTETQTELTVVQVISAGSSSVGVPTKQDHTHTPLSPPQYVHLYMCLCVLFHFSTVHTLYVLL